MPSWPIVHHPLTSLWYQPDEDEWDPYEENYEYEDMPGDNADEREEYYDNIDWDARD